MSESSRVVMSRPGRTARSEPRPGTMERGPTVMSGSGPEPFILETRELRTWYPGPSSLARTLLRRPSWVKAVGGVTLRIRRGEVLGVIGESGCGKSSLGRTLVKLENPSGGAVIFDGEDIMGLRGQALKGFRRRAQIIFQNPYESFDGRYTVRESLERPLLIHGIGSGPADRRARILEVLARAGLTPPESFAARYPHELSGGQLQRVSVGRVMLLDPEFVVADEPVSMLDVSVRAGVLNTLLDLRASRRSSILFITHDIGVARYMSDTVAVMYLGKVIETGPAERVIAGPAHPYTQALISHSPDPDPDASRPPLPVEGEPPTPIDPPPGCRFAPRCPKAGPRCAVEEPPPRPVGGRADHLAACHLVAGPTTIEGGEKS